MAWAEFDTRASSLSIPVHPPKPGGHRKHPVIARAGDGALLFVWTEGMAWNQGGTLHWQGYDSQGTATEVQGSTDGVPVWSRPAVVADSDGMFTVIY